METQEPSTLPGSELESDLSTSHSKIAAVDPMEMEDNGAAPMHIDSRGADDEDARGGIVEQRVLPQAGRSPDHDGQRGSSSSSKRDASDIPPGGIRHPELSKSSEEGAVQREYFGTSCHEFMSQAYQHILSSATADFDSLTRDLSSDSRLVGRYVSSEDVEKVVAEDYQRFSSSLKNQLKKIDAWSERNVFCVPAQVVAGSSENKERNDGAAAGQRQNDQLFSDMHQLDVQINERLRRIERAQVATKSLEESNSTWTQIASKLESSVPRKDPPSAATVEDTRRRKEAKADLAEKIEQMLDQIEKKLGNSNQSDSVDKENSYDAQNSQLDFTYAETEEETSGAWSFADES